MFKKIVGKIVNIKNDWTKKKESGLVAKFVDDTGDIELVLVSVAKWSGKPKSKYSLCPSWQS